MSDNDKEIDGKLTNTLSYELLDILAIIKLNIAKAALAYGTFNNNRSSNLWIIF